MIPITKPSLGAEEADAARRAIESGWVTQGPLVAEFERAVADYCGTAEAVAVSSCTAALHLALEALGVGPGDEVICPSMSFIATANSIRHAGATPVFADVDERTYNLDPDAVEAAITPRTKAVMVVHQIGLPADLDRFLALGERHGFKLLEDAACALGSRYKGYPIGGHTEMACFSFHPRKPITTGEGGMITTNDPRHACRLRLLRQHGMSVPDSVRHTAKAVITERYVALGYNYRMTDVQAAIGVEQMKKLDVLLARRRELAARYAAALADHPWLRPPYVPDGVEPNFQSYAVRMTDDAPLGRDELMQKLLDLGIATRRGIMLAHREPAYAGTTRSPPSETTQRSPPPKIQRSPPPGTHGLPCSERASDRSLLLPLYPQMTPAELNEVLRALGATS